MAPSLQATLSLFTRCALFACNDLCGQQYLSGTIEVDGERSHRAMVHSELPISVLFNGQDGAHLFAMTNRNERREPA
jgi:hypothetical protein